jgi:hypothetical protein
VKVTYLVKVVGQDEAYTRSYKKVTYIVKVTGQGGTLSKVICEGHLPGEGCRSR